MIKETQNFSFKVRNIEIWNNPNYTFHLNFVGEKLFIILSVSVLSVSVSADMKIIISVFYRYRPIWKKAYRSYTDPTLGIFKAEIVIWNVDFAIFFPHVIVSV